MKSFIISKKIFALSSILVIASFIIPNILPVQTYFQTPVAQAVAGVPKILSYQGRLTNATGALLGGAGTNYTFKFSIWNNPTPPTGSQIWPAGAPGTFDVNVAMAYSTSTSATPRTATPILWIMISKPATLFICKWKF